MKITRTLPIILFNRTKLLAREIGKNLSDIIAKAMDALLRRENLVIPETLLGYTAKAVHMGLAKVDLSDRDALHRVMDDQ